MGRRRSTMPLGAGDKPINCIFGCRSGGEQQIKSTKIWKQMNYGLVVRMRLPMVRWIGFCFNLKMFLGIVVIYLSSKLIWRSEKVAKTFKPMFSCYMKTVLIAVTQYWFNSAHLLSNFDKRQHGPAKSVILNLSESRSTLPIAYLDTIAWNPWFTSFSTPHNKFVKLNLISRSSPTIGSSQNIRKRKLIIIFV